MKIFSYTHLITLLFALVLTCGHLPAIAGTVEEFQDFTLDVDEESAAVGKEAPPPFTRPISKIAENVTVISADDIARLNAHTLEEVLQTVSGIQLFQVQTPGNSSLFTINGSLSRQVLVLIDGVQQNLLGAEESAELGMIPVQRIERIEIIKGAASVVWGPALGGVINIITRDPEPDARFAGRASASYGEQGTSDLGASVSGTTKRLGYYLDGGSFHSNGLLPANRVDLDHVTGKITYDLPGNGRLVFGADFREGDRSLGYGDRALGGGDNLITAGSSYKSAYLRFDYPLNDRLNLEFFTSAGQKDIRQQWEYLPLSFLIFDARNLTDSEQASAKLTWGDRTTNLAAGVEYLHDNIRVTEPKTGFPFLNFTRNLERYGAYLNGSYSLGLLTLIPGVRLDHIGINEDVSSYHLGATLQLTKNTLLRGYAARGYSLPSPNYRDSLQNIRTVQAGIESSDIPYLWLKGTFFYSNTWNIQTFVIPPDYPTSPISTVKTKEIRQGFEIEGRTVTWHDFSLAAGFSYSDVRDKDTDERIKYVPLTSTKLSLLYTNDELGLRGNIIGSYVDWPAIAGNSVHDKQIIWDLHLTQKLPAHGGVTPELFFSGRNLFDNAQYIDDFRKNTPRWLEGGVRFSF